MIEAAHTCYIVSCFATADIIDIISHIGSLGMHMRAIVGPDLQRVAAGDHSEDADDRALHLPSTVATLFFTESNDSRIFFTLRFNLRSTRALFLVFSGQFSFVLTKSHQSSKLT